MEKTNLRNDYNAMSITVPNKSMKDGFIAVSFKHFEEEVKQLEEKGSHGHTHNLDDYEVHECISIYQHSVE